MRVWGVLRSAPVVLVIALTLFVASLLASLAVAVAGAGGARDVAIGLFGISAAVLGVLLAGDVAGSSAAMERLAEVTARRPISGGKWTARRYRVLGAVYVVMGLLFAITAFTGVISR